MLALKKKREAEAKAKAEAEAAAIAGGGSNAVQSPGTAPSAPSSNKVSLLGAVGGKKKRSDNSSISGAKRRTPGEIRIQKGKAPLFWFCLRVEAAAVYMNICARF